MSKLLFDGITLEDFVRMIREVVRTEINEASNALKEKDYEPLLTRGQVCAQLHISLPTFHRWCKDGKIKVHKAGGRILVKRSDLESCLEEIDSVQSHVPP